MTISAEAVDVVHPDDGPKGNNRASLWSSSRRSPLRIVILGFSYVWLLALLLGAWEWRSRSHPSLFIPSPSDTLSRMRSVWFSGRPSRLFLSHDFHKHGWSSIRRWLIGFGLASLIGVIGGALLASFRRLNWMFQPLIRLGQSTPSIMLIPLAIVLFGINDKMTVSVIVYGSVWPVLINTIDGIAHIDPLTINSARALRLRRFSMLRIVTLRAASPQILAGLRVALGVSIILIVASELYASSSGIGYYITYSQRSLQFKNMFAGIALAALIGILANGLFYLLERRLLRWRPDNRGDRN